MSSPPPPPFVALDTETTGLDPTVDRVIELAWVRFEGGVVTDEGETLVSPGAPLPPAVARLTGLTDGLLRAAPPFVAVVPALAAALRGAELLVAYNAAFDRAFLQHELARANATLSLPPFLDPLRLVRALDDDEPHSLRAAAERYGLAVPEEHRALPDARAVGELLVRVWPRLAPTDVAGIMRAHARPAVRAVRAPREPS